MNENEEMDDSFDDEGVDHQMTSTSVESGDKVSMSDLASAMADKDAERLQLQSDIEAYLSRGGTIVEIPNDVVGDPPKKPMSSYGGQPI